MKISLSILASGLSLLASVVFASPSLGQNILVSGRVTDAETGEALVAATVALVEDRAGGYADKEGRYSFTFDRKGREKITILFSYAGYARIKKEVPLTGEKKIILDIAMTVEGFTTDAVVISTNKGFEQRQKDLTVSVDVIKPLAVSLQASADITAALNQVSGVLVMDEQISIRGSSGFGFGVGSRVTVMLDGIPLLTSDAGIADLRTLPVDNISSIEVIKSSSSVLYGSSSLGGVVNVITADPGPKPLTTVRFRSAIFGPPRYRAIDWDGPSAAYQASLHIAHARRIRNFDISGEVDLIRDSGYRQGTSRKEARAFLRMRYRPKNISGLSFGLNISGRVDSSGAMVFWRSYEPDTTVVTQGRDTSTFVQGGALTPTQNAGGFRRQLIHRLAIDPDITFLTPDGSLLRYRGRLYKNGTQNSTEQSSTNFQFYNEFLYQTTLFDRVTWVTGINYIFDEVYGPDVYGGVSIIDGDTLVLDGRYKSSSLGIYTQFDGTFGKFNVSLGARLHSAKVHTTPRETRPIFSAGVNYELTPGTNLRASFGQGFRVPLVAERYLSTTGSGIITIPNPNILSEYGYSAELGVRQGFQAGTRNKLQGYVDLAVFMRRFQNMIEFGIDSFVFVGQTAFFSTRNVSEARIVGAELSYGLGYKAQKWFASLNGGFTYTYPEDLNGVPDSLQRDALNNGPFDAINPNKVDQPVVLKYRPRWLIALSGTIGVGKVEFSANYRYRSYMESIDQFLYLSVPGLRDFRKAHPDGEQITDLIFTYKPNSLIRLSVNMSNAFNTEYMIYPGNLAEQGKLTFQFEGRF